MRLTFCPSETEDDRRQYPEGYWYAEGGDYDGDGGTPVQAVTDLLASRDQGKVVVELLADDRWAASLVKDSTFVAEGYGGDMLTALMRLEERLEEA